MQGDPSEEMGAALPRTEDPSGPLPQRPEGSPTPPSGPVYPGFPSYPQQPYYPAPPIYAPPPGPMPRKGPPWYAWVIGGCLVLLLLAGGTCAVLGVTIGNLFRTLANEKTTTANTSQSYAVDGVPTIVVHNAGGEVTIQPGDAGSVQVQTIRQASDTSTQAAESDLAGIVVTQTQSGNTITIDARITGATSLTRQLTADFIITVPSAATFDLETTAGGVTSQGVTFAGSSRALVTTGTVDLSGTLSDGASLDIEVTTGSVNLALPSDTSAHVDASTGVGSVSVTGWSIPIKQHGAGAQAIGDLGTAPQDRVTIHVTTGSIDLSAS